MKAEGTPGAKTARGKGTEPRLEPGRTRHANRLLSFALRDEEGGPGERGGGTQGRGRTTGSDSLADPDEAGPASGALSQEPWEAAGGFYPAW